MLPAWPAGKSSVCRLLLARATLVTLPQRVSCSGHQPCQAVCFELVGNRFLRRWAYLAANAKPVRMCHEQARSIVFAFHSDAVVCWPVTAGWCVYLSAPPVFMLSGLEVLGAVISSMAAAHLLGQPAGRRTIALCCPYAQPGTGPSQVSQPLLWGCAWQGWGMKDVQHLDDDTCASVPCSRLDHPVPPDGDFK
jgi:hypothetical protein